MKKSPLFIWNSLVTSNEFEDIFQIFVDFSSWFGNTDMTKKPLVVLFYMTFILKEQWQCRYRHFFPIRGHSQTTLAKFSPLFTTYLLVDIGKGIRLLLIWLYTVDIPSNLYLIYYLPHLVNVVWERPLTFLVFL